MYVVYWRYVIYYINEDLLACQEEVCLAELLIRQAQGRGEVFVFH